LKLKINIDNINKNYKFENRQIKKLMRLVFEGEKIFDGEIGVVFVDHNYITELNMKYLNKNSTTDVIAFPLNEPNNSTISGEIYVNLDQVAQQAQDYMVTFDQEMNRIIIHGLLHLMGYKDYSTSEREKMRAKEDFYLSVFG